jgi:site-specific DNA-methyltransferase (adenine-specific)
MLFVENGRESMELDTIYNENCCETMGRMLDASIDLTVTSPPYDNLRDYKGYSFDFESVARGLYRVTKPGGVVVWIVGDAVVDGGETGTSFRQALFFKEIGFRLHDTMIYEKSGSPFPETRRYTQSFEYMFVFTTGGLESFNPLNDKPNSNFGFPAHRGRATFRNKQGELVDGKRNYLIPEFGMRTNIWRYSTGKGNSTPDIEAYNHPAIFPEKLVADHILSWSNEGDIVYDPFMGSGTTAKMARLLQRKYIGSEIAAEYCEIAKKRLAQQVFDFT